MTRMSDAHTAGDIDMVVPEEKFEGVYRTMAHGVNEMVMGHIAVKKKAMACVAEFGKGNLRCRAGEVSQARRRSSTTISNGCGRTSRHSSRR